MAENPEQVASNLTIAFYSAVEPRPAFLGEDRRREKKPPTGLDLRNPSISPGEVFSVYKSFLQRLKDGAE